jgi:cleavage stimulation factor subunit 3
MSMIPNLNLGGDSSDDDMSVDDNAMDESILTTNNNTNSSVKPPVLLFQNDEEDEEVDEPLPVAPSNLAPVSATASEDYIDAWSFVQSNPNDVNSWKIYTAEIRSGNHGSASIADAYKPFFALFPRAYSIYWDYIATCLDTHRYHEAEELFQKSLTKARNPHLWILYTNYLRNAKHRLDVVGRPLDDYNNDRKTIESAFENAIENVGSSLNSYPLWKEYLDFVKSWPETGVYSDMGRKLLTLRKVYQRAVCIPIENLDQLWKEYEALERQTGEHLAEKVGLISFYYC